MTSDPDQIRDQITQTQRNLSADVDALTEKVSPPRIVARRIDRTRSAMTSMKERIMGSVPSGTNMTDTVSSQAAAAREAATSAASSAGAAAGSAAASAAGAVSSAAATAADTVSAAPTVVKQRTQGNPLAAGLIAFGAGWLISSLLPATPVEQRAASKVKDTAAEYGQPVARQLGEAARDAREHLEEPARQAARSVQDAASGAVSAVRDQAQTAAGDVAERATQATQTVREAGAGQPPG